MSRVIMDRQNLAADPQKFRAADGAFPEVLPFQFLPAPLFKRTMAFALDCAIIGVTSYGIFLAAIALFVGGAGALGIAKSAVQKQIGQSGGIVIAVLLSYVFPLILVFNAYFLFFERRKGTTPGKKIFGLRVISLKGVRLTLRQCLVRDFFRCVDCLFIFPGLLCAVLTERKQRIGDLAANTLVIHSLPKEDGVDYLYLSQQDYHWLYEVLVPRRIPLEVPSRYLAFAYPLFILRNQSPPPEKLSEWEVYVRQYFQGSTAKDFDQDTCLRFFAEHCLQTLNRTSPKKNP
jgi:uncharacterized RDD family membrane protein YckC